MHQQDFMYLHFVRGDICVKMRHVCVFSDKVMYVDELVTNAETDHWHKPFNCTNSNQATLRYIHYQ